MTASTQIFLRACARDGTDVYARASVLALFYVLTCMYTTARAYVSWRKRDVYQLAVPLVPTNSTATLIGEHGRCVEWVLVMHGALRVCHSAYCTSMR